MEFDTLINTVSNSFADDWHVMNVKTPFSWDYGSENDSYYLRPIQNDTVAVFKKDVDISLAFGATINDQFQEDWVKKFPDPTANSISITLRYRTAIIHQWLGVVVDGGRYLMPLPSIEGDEFVVSREELPLAKLMFDLYGQGGVLETLEQALKRAHVVIRA